MRKAVERMGAAALPEHMFMVVTSFRIPTHTTFKVYQSVFQEVQRMPVPCTVIASIVEKGDENFIKDIMRQEVRDRDDIKLIIVRARGTGKRDGLAHAFRALSRQMPLENAVVCVVDGDTMMLPGCVERAVSMFAYLPSVGGITTNEFCEVEGSKLMQEWHTMRFVQRHKARVQHLRPGRAEAGFHRRQNRNHLRRPRQRPGQHIALDRPARLFGKGIGFDLGIAAGDFEAAPAQGARPFHRHDRGRLQHVIQPRKRCLIAGLAYQQGLHATVAGRVELHKGGRIFAKGHQTQRQVEADPGFAIHMVRQTDFGLCCLPGGNQTGALGRGQNPGAFDALIDLPCRNPTSGARTKGSVDTGIVKTEPLQRGLDLAPLVAA
jgi:hypothetical protein